MSVQYGRKCFLCNNTRYRNKQCRLFRFPARGSPMWSKWLAALGLSEADIDVHSNAPPQLCQLHFEPKDFLQRRLSAMAVPKAHERNREKKKRVVIGNEDTPQIAGVVEKTHKAMDDNLSDVQLDGGQGSGSEADRDVDYETLSNCQDDLFEAESNEDESCYTPALDTTVEQSNAALGGTPLLSSPPACCIRQCEKLIKQLDKERAWVKKLLDENAQQRHIIEDQRSLLLQLGVQYTILDEAEGDS